MTYQTDIANFTTEVKDRLTVPVNQKNNLLVTTADGKFSGRSAFMQSSIVENDSELATQKGATESFQSVFKWWKRISRGGLTYTDTFNPAELDSWTYDSGTDSISCAVNSASVVGFVSPEKYEDYVFEAQLSSNNGDDDFVGLIIAYALDPTDGTTHTLSVMRGGNGRAPMIIDKDYNGFDTGRYNVAQVLGGLTWMNGVVATGPAANNGNGGWSLQPLGCRVKVTREKDIITVETSQVGSSVYVPAAKVIIDLSADPELTVFRGPQSFGYSAMSQQNATWKVFQRPDNRLPIVDVRDWSKWTYAAGTWTKFTGTKASLIASDLLVPEWTHQNTTTGKFFYMDSTTKLYRL
jgi:hypothetical protein